MMDDSWGLRDGVRKSGHTPLHRHAASSMKSSTSPRSEVDTSKLKVCRQRAGFDGGFQASVRSGGTTVSSLLFALTSYAAITPPSARGGPGIAWPPE